MARFSLQRIGFWRLFGVALIGVCIQAASQPYWKGIQLYRAGRRPPMAAIFIAVEGYCVMATVVAAMMYVAGAWEGEKRTPSKVLAVLIATLGLVGLVLIVVKYSAAYS